MTKPKDREIIILGCAQMQGWTDGVNLYEDTTVFSSDGKVMKEETRVTPLDELEDDE